MAYKHVITDKNEKYTKYKYLQYDWYHSTLLQVARKFHVVICYA